jgi:acyl-CoA reductase-like NAD-dependent aldehyde dehydrogenase
MGGADQAIQIVNGTEYGLAAEVYMDTKRALNVARQLRAGTAERLACDCSAA